MSEAESQEVEQEGGGAAPLPPKRPTIIRPSQDGRAPVPARPAPARPAPPAPGGRAPPTVPRPPVHAGATGTAIPPIPSRPGIPAQTPSPAPVPTPAPTPVMKHEPSTKDAGKHRSQGSVRKRPEITIVDARPMSQAGFRDMKVPEVAKPVSAAHQETPTTSSNGNLPAVPSRPPPVQSSPQPHRPPPPPARPSVPPPESSPQSEDLADHDAAPSAPSKPSRPTILRPPRPKSAVVASENVLQDNKASSPPPLPKRSPMVAEAPATDSLINSDPPPKPARSKLMDSDSPGEEKMGEDETDMVEGHEAVKKPLRGSIIRPRPRPKLSVEEGQGSVEKADEPQEALSQESPRPKPRIPHSRPVAVVAGHPHDSLGGAAQGDAEHVGNTAPPVPAARPKSSPRGGPDRPLPPATAPPSASSTSDSPRLPEPLLPSKPPLPSSAAPPIPASHPSGLHGTGGHPPVLPAKPPPPPAAAIPEAGGALYAVSEPLGDSLDRAPAPHQPARPPPPVPKSRPQPSVPPSSMAGRPLPTVPSMPPAESPSSPSSELNNFYEDVDEVKTQVHAKTVPDKPGSLPPEKNQSENTPLVESKDDISAMYAKVNKPKTQSSSTDAAPLESAAANPFGIKLKHVGPEESIGSEEGKPCHGNTDSVSTAVHKPPLIAPKPKPTVSSRPQPAPKPTSQRKEVEVDTLANPPVVEAKPEPGKPPPLDIATKPEPTKRSPPDVASKSEHSDPTQLSLPDIATKPEHPEPTKPPLPDVAAKPEHPESIKRPPPEVASKPEHSDPTKPPLPDVAAKPEHPEPTKPPPTAKRPTIIRPHRPAPVSEDGGQADREDDNSDVPMRNKRTTPHPRPQSELPGNEGSDPSPVVEPPVPSKRPVTIIGFPHRQKTQELKGEEHSVASEHQHSAGEVPVDDNMSKVSEALPEVGHAASEKAETSPQPHRPPPPRPGSRPPPPKPSPPAPLQESASSKPDSESAPPRPPSPAPSRPSNKPVKEMVSSDGEEEGGGGERKDEEEEEVRTGPQRPSGPPPRPMSMPPVKPPLSAAVKAHAAGAAADAKSEKPAKPQPVRAAPHREANKHLTPPGLPRRPGLSHPLYGYMASQPHAIAVHDYPAKHDDELPFQEGDTVVLLKRVDEQWLKGKVGDKEGIFPQNFVTIIHPLHGEVPPSAMDDMIDTVFEDVLQEKPDLLQGPRCRARFDFEGEGHTDLSFEDGDVIQLLAHCGGDWLKGELNGKQGIFPASFVEIIEDLPEESHESPRGTGSEVTALFDFSGESGELSFQAGDKIRILSKVNEQWLYGECAGGNQGSFPASFVDEIPLDLPLHDPGAASQSAVDRTQSEQHKPTYHQDVPDKPQCFCTALHGFEKAHDGDLEFIEGDLIEILEEVGEDWLRGRLAGTEGIFPKAFVSLENSGAGWSHTEDFSHQDHGTGLDVHSNLVMGKALFDFDGQADVELNFKAGDEIVLGSMVSEDSEWQWGELHGKKGMFPANFVEMV